MPISALVVFVPEADPILGELRMRFDPSARQGMASHITILVPFADPSDIEDKDIKVLEQAFAEVSAFEFALGGVGRFPETVYVAPDPSQPFIGLTRAVTNSFPSYKPYGGAHMEIVPHLTVSDGSTASAEGAEAVLHRALAAAGTVSCMCSSVHLIDNASGGWRVRHVFKLANGGA